MRTVFFSGLVGLLATVSITHADAPKPSPTPVSWELEINVSSPSRIVVNTGREAQVFWYVLYTIVNNTGHEVTFRPEIVRVNEIESEVPAERAKAVPNKAARLTVDPALIGPDPRVYRAIRQRHAKTHPFLVTPVDVMGPLLQGRDNARTSVAIFSDLDPRVSKFTIYFSGLSGETIKRRNPAYDKSRTRSGGAGEDDTESHKYFVLRKTLAIPYTLPGDVHTRGRATPVLGKMTWVMR